MKRKLFAASLAAAVSAGFCGCTTIRELPRAERAAEETPEQALCRELLMAFLKNDGKKFCGLLPEDSRKNFTVEIFEKTRKSIVESQGEPVSFQYVTSLEMTALTPHVWKIRFQRENKDGEKFTSEVLFRIITGKIDGRPVITSFQFI